MATLRLSRLSCTLIAIAALCWIARGAEPQPPVPSIPVADLARESTVRIVATTQRQDLLRPWSLMQPSQHTGSGVVIDGPMVLTNYHVVRYAKSIEVFTAKGAQSFTATVVAVAPTVDLALLSMPEEFVESRVPAAPLDTTWPRPRDAVVLHGFPLGAQEGTVTKGVVSRLEYTEINYGGWGTRLQIDAAANPGNSGGAVFSARGIAGVAYAANTRAENVTFAVAADEVERFVAFARSVANAAPRETDSVPMWTTPWLDISTQRTDNERVRDTLTRDPVSHGILIRDTRFTSIGDALQRNDLLLSIDDSPIDSLGRVSATSDWQVDFRFLLRDKVGKQVRFDVIRRGAPTALQATVLSTPPPVCAPVLFDRQVTYAVVGPLVLQVASEELVQQFLSDPEWLQHLVEKDSRLIKTRHGRCGSDGEVVFMAGPALPHKSLAGFPADYALSLKAINEREISTLRQALAIIGEEVMKSKHVRFEFSEFGSPLIVLPASELREITLEVQRAQGISKLCSDDLRETYNAALNIEAP